MFPDVVGLPEVGRDDLALDIVRSGVFHHGGLIIRGLLAAPTAAKFPPKIDQLIKAQAAHQRAAPSAEIDATYSPFELPRESGALAVQRFERDMALARSFVKEQGGVFAVDAPQVLFEIIDTFERAGITKLVTDFFGERPTMLAKKWALRCMEPYFGALHTQPKEQPVDAGWHQDGAFMGADIRSLNVWIALSRCGDDAPSMDVVARRLDAIAETGVHGANFDWSVGSTVAERVAQGAIVRPCFAPGDALLFDHLFLHRTDTHEGMTRPRYAIESWFASPSSAPSDYLPIVF